MRQRIQTLDGLRFLAAIGVLWIHSWTFHGNPRFYIWKLDAADILAVGGNGVDLFFVISGFCMYYFYGSKSEFSYHDFWRFIVKRWVRLSPAFYFSTIIYLTVWKYDDHFSIKYVLNFLHSVFYLHNILPQYTTAGHFWTLTVEWQFYFILPFLLIYQRSVGFKRIFPAIFGFIFLAAIISVLILTNKTDIQTDTILFRAIEFGFGIISARLLINDSSYFKYRLLWMIGFILITYFGKILVSKQVLHLSNNYYNIFRLFGFAFMGLGFAGILYLSVTSVKWLNFILGNKLFKSMGKISYSFYLLHELFYATVAKFVMQNMTFFYGIMAPVATTVICTVILYPVSLLSFNLLEKPFLSIGNLTTK